MVTHLRTLCKGLPLHGYAAHIAAPPDLSLGLSPAPPQSEVAIGSKLNLAADLAAAKQVAALPGDLLHGHGLRGMWIGALSLRHSPRPFVVTAHNLPPSMNPLARIAVRWAFRKANRVIAVSQSAANQLKPLVLPGRTVVIYNGIEIVSTNTLPSLKEARDALGISQTAEVIAGIGRLSREKGFDLLVTIASLTRGNRTRVFLAIGGEGPQRATLEDEIVRESEAIIMGDLPFARLLGKLDDPTLLYRAADVIAIPSREEAFGLVAVEAMAAERAVIAFDVGGLREVIAAGFTGILVPSVDAIGQPNVMGMYTTLSELLNSPDKLHDMGKAGRKLVEQKFTAEKMIAATCKVYDEVLGAPSN
jgi:glycosyltransferase involved in cell wall biosynthesis